MLYYLSSALILGLAAGFGPGPLTALIISESLKFDFRAGLKVALAPLLTDLPIILISFYFLNEFKDSNLFLGIISLVGGIFVLYIGYSTFKTKSISLSDKPEIPRSMLKGVLVNVLSPHPYLFWFSIGGPIFIKGMQENILGGILFISLFYFLLIGAKITIALIAVKSKRYLHGKAYFITMKVLAILLFVFGLYLIKDGLTLAGWG